MKEYVSRFLNKERTLEVVEPEFNAERALKECHIPIELWLEMSDAIPGSALMRSIIPIREQPRLNTAFMAGFVCGWVQKSWRMK